MSFKSHLFLIFIFFIPILNCALAGDNWRDSFHRYPSAQHVTAPKGFIVKSQPSRQAQTLKETYISGKIKVVGYVETHEGRFYMSYWSWKRTLEGETPNWIWIKGSDYPRSTGRGNDYSKLPLHCLGTEPFWSMTISEQGIQFREEEQFINFPVFYRHSSINNSCYA